MGKIRVIEWCGDSDVFHKGSLYYETQPKSGMYYPLKVLPNKPEYHIDDRVSQYFYDLFKVVDEIEFHLSPFYQFFLDSAQEELDKKRKELLTVTNSMRRLTNEIGELQAILDFAESGQK